MTKILIDSASDIELAEARELGLEYLSVPIIFGTEEFLDGETLSHPDFFRLLAERPDEVPKTSQINEYRYSEAFERATADGSELLVMSISSRLSGTIECARNAAKNFGDKIRIFDTLNASGGEGILCRYALSLLGRGLTASEICDKLEEKRGKVRFFAVLDTLKYLKLGGRISALTAITGGLLSVKPLISVVDGEIKSVGKAIGNKRANKIMTKFIDDCGGIDFSMPYTFVYSGLDASLINEYLKDNAHLIEELNGKEPTVTMIGSSIGTYIGDGAIGLAFFEK